MKEKRRRVSSLSLVLVVCLGCMGMTGCATSSAFKSYTSQANVVISDVKNGNIEHALSELEKNTASKDQILYLMERGRVAQMSRNIDASMADFEKAIASIRVQEDKAKISAGDIGSTGASVLVNDNVIPYKGYGYEKVFVYQFQAMNYLAKGDLEGAGVEVARANQQQDWEMNLHVKELDKIENEKKEQREKSVYNEDELQDSVNSSYSSMSELASTIKNSFQNAYSYYVTGLIYELENKLDDAFIDYQKALEIFPKNTYLQKDLIRLAKNLDYQEDFERYTSLYPESAKSLINPIEDNQGDIIVLYERGFVPQKKEIWLPLPLYGGIVKTALPIYGSDSGSEPCLEIISEGKSLGTTELICDVRCLAIKNLYEQLPGIITREIARVIAKTLVQKTAKENLGIFGTLGSGIYTMVTSKADLRAWYTLPNDVQIMRTSVKTGDIPITLQRMNGSLPLQITVHVEPSRQTIVRVIDVGSSCFLDTYTF